MSVASKCGKSECRYVHAKTTQIELPVISMPQKSERPDVVLAELSPSPSSSVSCCDFLDPVTDTALPTFMLLRRSGWPRRGRNSAERRRRDGARGREVDREGEERVGEGRRENEGEGERMEERTTARKAEHNTSDEETYPCVRVRLLPQGCQERSGGCGTSQHWTWKRIESTSALRPDRSDVLHTRNGGNHRSCIPGLPQSSGVIGISGIG